MSADVCLVMRKLRRFAKKAMRQFRSTSCWNPGVLDMSARTALKLAGSRIKVVGTSATADMGAMYKRRLKLFSFSFGSDRSTACKSQQTR